MIDCAYIDLIEYIYWQLATFDIDDILLTEGQALQWFSGREIRDMAEDDFSFGFRDVLFDFFKEHH